MKVSCADETKPVFQCRLCGQCCMGEGGIVLGPRDLKRLSQRFELEESAFLLGYAVFHNGKYKIRTGPDGNCLFFGRDHDCKVHEDKPDVCKAWPFFRGNLIDAESMTMAKDFCPGIRKDASHEEFVTEGLAWLSAGHLEATDSSCEANALISIKVRSEKA